VLQVFRAAGEVCPRVPADVRWVGLHVGVPDLAPIRRRPPSDDLRWQQRDHEGAHC